MGFSILNLNDFIYKMETLNLWEYFSEFARVSENADFLPEDIRIYTLEDDMTSDILAIGAVSSTYRNQQNEWHVWEFQTNSKFQNKGYGELLFKHILEDSDGIMSLCTLDSKAYGFWKHMLKKHINIDQSSRYFLLSVLYEELFLPSSLDSSSRSSSMFACMHLHSSHPTV